jgi:hypothetical protein
VVSYLGYSGIVVVIWNPLRKKVTAHFRKNGQKVGKYYRTVTGRSSLQEMGIFGHFLGKLIEQKTTVSTEAALFFY